MTIYSYKAIDKEGASHNGTLEAPSPQMLRQQLKQRGLRPLSIGESTRYTFRLRERTRKVFSTNALTAFTRRLSILIDGGLQLEKALQLAAMQTSSLKQRVRIHAVRGKLIEGSAFSDSLSAYPDDFPTLYRAAIAAGERAGDLGGILNKLADHGETHQQTMGKVKLAMMYPVILAAFALFVVIGMMVYIVPDITRAFIQSGQTLPWITRTLIAVSDALRHYGLVMMLVLALAIFGIRRILAKPDIRLALDKRLLKLLLVGSMIMSINMARFTGTLSMLIASGVHLAEALRIASDVLGNQWLKSSALQVTGGVLEGTSLSQALVHSGAFPTSFVSMVAGGEASGELARVFNLAAKNETKELENRMMFGVALLEPAIILSLGLMVLLIVVAIMLPIMSMNQLVK